MAHINCFFEGRVERDRAEIALFRGPTSKQLGPPIGPTRKKILAPPLGPSNDGRIRRGSSRPEHAFARCRRNTADKPVGSTDSVDPVARSIGLSFLSLSYLPCYPACEHVRPRRARVFGRRCRKTRSNVTDPPLPFSRYDDGSRGVGLKRRAPSPRVPDHKLSIMSLNESGRQERT